MPLETHGVKTPIPSHDNVFRPTGKFYHIIREGELRRGDAEQEHDTSRCRVCKGEIDCACSWCEAIRGEHGRSV